MIAWSTYCKTTFSLALLFAVILTLSLASEGRRT
nr:MAG TPA: Glycine rich protein family [Caudoviricetes sp.]